VAALRHELPALLDDVAGAMRTIDEEYAQFLTTDRSLVLAAAQGAIEELVDAAEDCLTGAFDAAVGVQDGEHHADVALVLFEGAGRDQWRRDLPLRRLLMAYQVGGRVAWRHISSVAMALGVPSDVLAALAEAVFRLVDRISSVTVDGFLREQAESAGVREQLRDALAERLLSDRAAEGAVKEAARRAGWALPEEAAVVLIGPEDEHGRQALARMPPTCLQLRTTVLPGVIVPDPGAPGARQRLVVALRGVPAVVGRVVPLHRLPESARIAEAAAQTFGLPPSARSPLFVDDHLGMLIVHRDERLLGALRERCLEPLDHAAPGSRDALRRTLQSWLVNMGDRQAIARDLFVHPQTVSYRLARLHELFGPALDDPAARMQLLLALGWDDER
jgi:PucR C-terminal helix-turn-helix domain